jgi:alpha-tubulin suppressor-like RCC1 family protein
LGNGTNGFADVPVAVNGLSGVTSVSSGFYYVCALVALGASKCWGLGQSGQLGTGSSANTAVPLSVSGSKGYTGLSAGNDDTCVIVPPGGGLTCWGSGDSGGLGNGATTSGSATPVAISGLTGVSQVAMGGYFGCARVNGAVSCWGDGALGQLGSGSSPAAQPTPVAVIGISTATQIAVGEDHACAIIGPTATVECWGNNLNGELGDGTTKNSNIPVPVVGLTNVSAVTAGQNSSCALLATGTVDCWGSNNYGQIGNGQTGGNVPIPTAVSNLTGVTSLSGFGFTNCAIIAGGAVDCWGYGGDGQDGYGAQLSTNLPVAVTGLTNVKSISAGYSVMCALTSTNTVDCWGYNLYGQLGNGVFATYTSPLTIAGLTVS